MILYLGIDPSGWETSKPLFHYPIIKTEKIDSVERKEAVRLWPFFTHVIFTSRSAVRYWWEEGLVFDKLAVAIGDATAKELHQRGVEPLVALEAIQEGIIKLIEPMDLQNAFLFLPRSKKARSSLNEYLTQRGVPFFSLDLYDTFPNRVDPIPNLEDFEEIVFTSPSTVEAFLMIYGQIPKDKKLTAIGPITQRALCRDWI